MQVASFVIALLALVVSGLSLGWQVLSFGLSGRRANASLSVGLRRGDDCTGISTINEEFLRGLKRQGLDTPVLGVTVRNRGRLPLYVHGVQFMWEGTLASWVPRDRARGPELPHGLEPGEQRTWWADILEARRVVEDVKPDAFSQPVKAAVYFGDGKSVTTSQSFRLAHVLRALETQPAEH